MGSGLCCNEAPEWIALETKDHTAIGDVLKTLRTRTSIFAEAWSGRLELIDVDFSVVSK
jgi:hypothetical protein